MHFLEKNQIYSLIKKLEDQKKLSIDAFLFRSGSCWAGAFSADAVHDAISLPENVRVTAMLPIGYAADDAEPAEFHSKFRELDDTVTEM